MSMEKSMREAYGEALVELGKIHEDVVALDADLAHATCSYMFKEEFPERFFNIGIAEQNMYCIAAGMSKSGFVPFASTFAMFSAGRAYEQIRNSIGYAKSNVKIMGSHAGITACGDGGTHQCIEDLALMRVIPGMTVICPCDFNQARILVKKSYDLNGPVYIRISRPPVPVFTDENDELEIGKAQILKDGKDICLIATGITVDMAVKAAKMLGEKGVDAAVLNIHTLKPIDTGALLRFAEKCKRIVTVEEHSIIGGLASAVTDAISGKCNFSIEKIGVEDRFGQSGLMPELMKEYGLNPENIYQKCLSMCK